MMGVEVFKAKRKEDVESKTEAETTGAEGHVLEDIDLESKAKENNQLPMQTKDELNEQPVQELKEGCLVESENKVGDDFSSSSNNKNECTKNIENSDNADISDLKNWKKYYWLSMCIILDIYAGAKHLEANFS